MNTVFVSYAAHETNCVDYAGQKLRRCADDNVRVPLEAGMDSTKIVKKLMWRTGPNIWRCQRTAWAWFETAHKTD